jgi:hypothetical protein
MHQSISAGQKLCALTLMSLLVMVQAATPLSPTSAHRSMTNNCDMLLTAADHVEESEPGTNHSAEDSPALTCQSFAVGARAPLGGSSGGPPTQGGGWQGTGVAMGIPVTGRVPAAPGVLPATAGWQVPPAVAPRGARSAQSPLAVATAAAARQAPVGLSSLPHLQPVLYPQRQPPSQPTPGSQLQGGARPQMVTSIPLVQGMAEAAVRQVLSQLPSRLPAAQPAGASHAAMSSGPLANGGMVAGASQQQRQPAAGQAAESAEGSSAAPQPSGPRPRINYFLNSRPRQPQPQPQQSAPLQQAAQPRPPPSQAAPKQALPPVGALTRVDCRLTSICTCVKYTFRVQHCFRLHHLDVQRTC